MSANTHNRGRPRQIETNMNEYQKAYYLHKTKMKRQMISTQNKISKLACRQIQILEQLQKDLQPDQFQFVLSSLHNHVFTDCAGQSLASTSGIINP